MLLASLVGTAAVLSRTITLPRSLWHDEVMTLTQWVLPGAAAALSPASTANNHPLFSLLTCATTALLGTSEAVVRLWGVLPGLAAIALVGVGLARRHGAVAGLTAMGALTVSPALAWLSSSARGYGFALLAGGVLLLAAAALGRVSRSHAPLRSARALGRKPRERGADLAFVLAGGLGVAAYPFVALGVLGHLALLALRAPRRAGLLALGVGLVAAPVIVPVLPGLLCAGRRLVGPGLAPAVTASQAGDDGGALQTLARGLVPGLPQQPDILLAAGVLVGLAALGGLGLLAWRRDPLLLAHVLVPPVVVIGLLQLTGFFTTPRFLSFMLPHYAVMLGLGAAELGRLFGSRTARRAVGALGSAVLVVLLGAIVVEAAHDQRVPLENPARAAEVIDGAGVQTVLTNTRRRLPGLQYYVGRGRVRSVGAVLPEAACGRAAPFAVVWYREEGPGMDLSCLERRGARPIHIPSRARPQVVYLLGR